MNWCKIVTVLFISTVVVGFAMPDGCFAIKMSGGIGKVGGGLKLGGGAKFGTGKTFSAPGVGGAKMGRSSVVGTQNRGRGNQAVDQGGRGRGDDQISRGRGNVRESAERGRGHEDIRDNAYSHGTIRDNGNDRAGIRHARGGGYRDDRHPRAAEYERDGWYGPFDRAWYGYHGGYYYYGGWAYATPFVYDPFWVAFPDIVIGTPIYWQEQNIYIRPLEGGTYQYGPTAHGPWTTREPCMDDCPPEDAE